MLYWLINNSDEVEITMDSIFVIGKKQKKIENTDLKSVVAKEGRV